VNQTNTYTLIVSIISCFTAMGLLHDASLC